MRARYGILIMFGLLVTGTVALYVRGKHLRRERADSIVSNLKGYKSAHGKYPSDLSKINEVDTGWLYYSVDINGRQFRVAYSSGIMEINTNEYDSEKGKWETWFAY